MHIDDVSRKIENWLRQVAPDAEVAVVAALSAVPEPSKDAAAQARAQVDICFQSITHQRPDRGARSRDELFQLAYLVRVSGPNPLAGQRILSEIYFAVHEAADFDIISSTGNVRSDMGGGPATLLLVARLVRPARPVVAGKVTQPLEAHLRQVGRIAGRVVTEDGSPVMRAQIEAPALDKRAVSDASGRFVIVGAPSAGSVSLTVTARNRSMEVSIDAARQSDVTIVITKESAHA
jgi:hypothetical protein